MSKDNINISKTTKIGKKCREEFLPTALNRCFGDYGIQMGGLSNLRDEYHIYRPFPLFHLLLYTISGTGQVTFANGRRRLLKAGDLLTLPAEHLHSYGIDGSDWQILWLHLNPETTTLLWGVKKTMLLKELQHLFSACFEFMHNPAGEEELIYSMYAQLIIGTVRREFNTRPSSSDHETAERLNDLLKEINAQPSKNWSVQKMAQKTFLSEGYFFPVFKKHIGMSPMDKVLELRMLRACEYFRNTDWRLDRIADLLGYADQFAFSKAFKRWKGVSPKAYRNN